MDNRLKFRAWDKKNKKMIYGICVGGYGEVMALERGEDCWPYSDCVIPMQCTGLVAAKS